MVLLAYRSVAGTAWMAACRAAHEAEEAPVLPVQLSYSSGLTTLAGSSPADVIRVAVNITGLSGTRSITAVYLVAWVLARVIVGMVPVVRIVLLPCARMAASTAAVVLVLALAASIR